MTTQKILLDSTGQDVQIKYPHDDLVWVTDAEKNWGTDLADELTEILL
jgi:hypothetical protein